ncbi:MAG: adenylate kinase family protein [Metallosphaera sp.]
MIIVISGTPGVGKTVVSSLLSKRLSMSYLHVSNFVIDRKLYKNYDTVRSSYEIDDELVAKELNAYLKSLKNVVVETVYPSLVDYADKVIVLRRDPRELYKELNKRAWNVNKVIENVEAEILGYVSQEASEWFRDVCEINTTNLTPEEVVEKILAEECEKIIDWLADPEIQEFMLSLDKIIN